MIDRLLLERLQDAAEELQRMALALPGGDAVARVARALSDVEVADVAEPDDEKPSPRC
jgi:hypothetical protein